jgi:hypothetical protein
MKPAFLRHCTEIDTFVSNHGVDAYKESFRPNQSLDELLLDPVIYRSNETYEQKHGAGITEDHICDFIEYWGAEQYKNWCARDTPYDSIISNARFASSQQKFLEKKLSLYNDDVDVGFRTTSLHMNPFRQEFRDNKGISVPEPPTYPKLDDFYDPEYSVYIQNNGIINYMLKVMSINRLEHLLNYKEVAAWQRSYIQKLDYDNKLI